MKTFRLSRKVQIILATIFVIVVGAIMVETFANNRATATYTDCPNGDQSVPKIDYYDDSYHYWICQECGASCGVESHEKYSRAMKIDGTYHGWRYQCRQCAWVSEFYTTGPHENNSSGVCIHCGETNDLGPGSGSGSGGGGGGGSSSDHTCSNFTTHYKIRQKVPADNEYHARYFVCDLCGFSWYDCDFIHKGADHYNGGKCEDCGYQYQSHAQSTQKTYNQTDITHTEVYKCTYSGCNVTYDGYEEPHEGATHENGGECTVCGYQYETHGKSTMVDYYNTTVTTHTPVYYCTEAGCSITYTGTSEKHKGATHENGGVCTVQGCEYQYQIHAESNTPKEYKKTATGHTPVYSCTYTGCTSTFNGMEQEHTGGTHANDGICTVLGCGYKYQTHNQSNTVKEYQTTATGHTPVYTCTESSCTTTFNGTEQEHTGGTHENGGTCTVCGEQYQTHNQSNTVKEYQTTATGHTPVYKCTEASCTTTYYGTEEAHTGGTHENGGTCTVCGEQYQTHSQSSTIKQYKTTATGHTPVYACTQDGCTVTYEGPEEAHNYENGECKDCKSEEPTISIDIGKYEILEAYVTQIQPKTTASTLKNNIETNAEEINIYNLNNVLLKDTDIIGTGMKLELKKGTQIKTFTLIVRGDVNGDGTATMADILIINQYRLNKRSLEEIYLIAGDVTGDAKLDFFDIIKINRYKLSKITEL